MLGCSGSDLLTSLQVKIPLKGNSLHPEKSKIWPFVDTGRNTWSSRKNCSPVGGERQLKQAFRRDVKFRMD